MFDWCCTGSIDRVTKQVTIEEMTGVEKKVDGKVFDITVASDWMEFVERSEDRLEDVGGAGAYDTLRCDLIPNNRTWCIWGEDYHLQRLTRSYGSLVQSTGEDGKTGHDKDIAEAVKDSKQLFTKILDNALQSKVLLEHASDVRGDHDPVIQLIRFTWLWSPSSDGDDKTIIVRGHACAYSRPMKIHQPVDPIVVTIAASAAKDHHSADVDTSMPSRFEDPQNKVASWARKRKTLDNPKTYKPEGVSEVLMVRPKNGELELLEGLSSNVFVIYKDGTLRTASEGVLNGYVRHLVLECAEKCGLKYVDKPILLSEDDQWGEAFITSSSRLIFPISRMKIHTKDGTEFYDYWVDPVLSGQVSNQKQQKWRDILDEILSRAGYPAL